MTDSLETLLSSVGERAPRFPDELRYLHGAGLDQRESAYRRWIAEYESLCASLAKRLKEAEKGRVEVQFAFDDWQRMGKSIYSTEEGIELSMGSLHSGTVFAGSIAFDDEELEDVRAAMASKAMPVFMLFEIGTGEIQERAR